MAFSFPLLGAVRSSNRKPVVLIGLSIMHTDEMNICMEESDHKSVLES